MMSLQEEYSSDFEQLLNYIKALAQLPEKDVKFLKALKVKADNWDKLEAKITAIYDGPEDKGDLGDIGEIAAMAFGYL